MKYATMLLPCIIGLFGCSERGPEQNSDPMPLRFPVALEDTQFSSAEVVDRSLLLTIRGSWMVRNEGDQSLVRDGGRIVLAPGAKAQLSERHIIIDIEYLPPEGLFIDSKFDGRSFGQNVEYRYSLLRIRNEN